MDKKVEFQRSVNGDHKGPKVCILINRHCFFLHDVFLYGSKGGGFRLIVIKAGKVLKDEIYRTYRGARIAFLRQFRGRLFDPEMGAEWTPFFDPDRDWLQNKLKLSKV